MYESSKLNLLSILESLRSGGYNEIVSQYVQRTDDVRPLDQLTKGTPSECSVEDVGIMTGTSYIHDDLQGGKHKQTSFQKIR